MASKKELIETAIRSGEFKTQREICDEVGCSSSYMSNVVASLRDEGKVQGDRLEWVHHSYIPTVTYVPSRKRSWLKRILRIG